MHYWRVAHAQHFDAFLGVPALAGRYLPLLPYAWHGLDRIWAQLHDNGALADATVKGRPRSADDGSGILAPLTREHLQLP